MRSSVSLEDIMSDSSSTRTLKNLVLKSRYRLIRTSRQLMKAESSVSLSRARGRNENLTRSDPVSWLITIANKEMWAILKVALPRRSSRGKFSLHFRGTLMALNLWWYLTQVSIDAHGSWKLMPIESLDSYLTERQAYILHLYLLETSGSLSSMSLADQEESFRVIDIVSYLFYFVLQSRKKPATVLEWNAAKQRNAKCGW